MMDSRRVMPESSPAVGASVSDGCDLVRRSVFGEYLAAAILAGVGSFVGEGLDLSGDEPYFFHGSGLPIGLFC